MGLGSAFGGCKQDPHTLCDASELIPMCGFSRPLTLCDASRQLQTAQLSKKQGLLPPGIPVCLWPRLY